MYKNGISYLGLILLILLSHMSLLAIILFRGNYEAVTDVGLLAAMYADGLQLKILNNEADINFGAIYENAIAQELHAHGFELYYFNSKKQGELDFVIE